MLNTNKNETIIDLIEFAVPPESVGFVTLPTLQLLSDFI